MIDGKPLFCLVTSSSVRYSSSEEVSLAPRKPCTCSRSEAGICASLSAGGPTGSKSGFKPGKIRSLTALEKITMPAWSSSWQLPDQIADVLPLEARHIEELRRLFLDTARSYGYELVMPPLLEHLESLLTGTGEALDLQTFKLVDQLSGRTLGLRADTTPQVARIDAPPAEPQRRGPSLLLRARAAHPR